MLKICVHYDAEITSGFFKAGVHSRFLSEVSPPGVTKALEEMDTDRLRLYPDPTAAPLVNALADFYHVNPDQVFVGVGSDDVLSMCFLTFFNSEKPVFFPDITYSFYKVWADLYRIPPYASTAFSTELKLR